MNTVRFARACPSYTKLAWLTNHTQELQGTSRDTAAAVAIVIVVVAAVIAATAAAATAAATAKAKAPLMGMQPRPKASCQG